jgi:hypothetical protein
MLHKHKSLARLLTASLAIAAIAPATAGAVPAIEGQGVAAGGGPGVTPQTLITPAPDQVDRGGQPNQDLRAPDQINPAPQSKQDLRAPDQVGGGVVATPSNVPQWPQNPQPIGHTGNTATAKPKDDGLSTEAIVLIAVGGVVLVATAGLGLARRKRARTDRQRQLA